MAFKKQHQEKFFKKTLQLSIFQNDIKSYLKDFIYIISFLKDTMLTSVV